MTGPTALFVSHGAPSLPIDDVPARSFLQALGQDLPRPKAIIAVSAHYVSRTPQLGGAAAPETVHDFGGFPAELYQLHYPAPGAPDLATQAKACLDDAGLPATVDLQRGLDHGIWVPLMLMWPAADIPVVPMSLQPRDGSAHHYSVGEALRPLAAEGILIFATGAATHDLAGAFGHALDTPPHAYAQAFDDWLCDRIEAGASTDLLEYREKAPEAARNHPTEEHLQPLFVALGATGGTPGRTLHRSFTFGAISMATYAFG